MSGYSNFNCAGGDTQNQLYKQAKIGLDYSSQYNTAVRVRKAIMSGSFSNWRIVFLGYSLTREHFISFGCLSNIITDVAIPWQPVSARHANDMIKGEHSIYYSAKARLSTGTDMVYYHLPYHMKKKKPYIDR
mmetsp:Transcript_55538/g.66791  ORF Transcript_55538/g.66791 Transcript_55538/m.66791 type:complete len:132 (-) Transcript_55538:536-931(-)